MPAVQSDLPTFDSLALPAEVVSVLARQEITSPTPVQTAVIPDAMSGHDVLGRAQTGSGKTLAFGLPILARLVGERSRPKHPRALIVVPTRELATQVRRSLEPLAHAVHLKLTTVYGGTPYDKQIKQLRNGADIVVATPGRLEDLINRGACRMDDIAITVLDEADHLCDLGFYPVVDQLMRETPEGSQRLLLSATLDGDVDKLVRTHLRAPKRHELNAVAASITTMEHHVMVVGGYRDKVATTTSLVQANPRSIVFVRTREGATELAESLTEGGIEAVDLHGNLSQRVRERNLHKFSTGRAQVVVATDVAARGIHVDHVGLVIHYDAPADAKAYLHRSGRTARAGLSGAVITITTRRQLDEIVRLQSRAGVESRHHDMRTAPRPMTAEALARSGEPAPALRRGGPFGGGPSRGGPSRGGPSRGGKRAGQRPGSAVSGGYKGERDRRDGGGSGGQRDTRDGGGYKGGRKDWRSSAGYRGNGEDSGSPQSEEHTRSSSAHSDRRENGAGRRERGGAASGDRRTAADRRTSDSRGSERPDFRDRGFRRDARPSERPTSDRPAPARPRRDEPANRRSGDGRPANRDEVVESPRRKPRWSQAGR